jgi:hypothetical protein
MLRREHSDVDRLAFENVLVADRLRSATSRGGILRPSFAAAPAALSG